MDPWHDLLDEDGLLPDLGDIDAVPHTFVDVLPPATEAPPSPYDTYCTAVEQQCAAAVAALPGVLARLGWAQKQAGVASDPAHPARLDAVRAQLRATRADAQRCLQAAPLRPATLGALRALEGELALHEAQLEVFALEYAALRERRPLCAARLFVAAQHCGHPVKQHAPAQAWATVRLLAGAQCAVRPASAVQAALELAGGTALPLEGATVDMTPAGEAHFGALRFPAGSRAQPVALRFRVNIVWSGPHCAEPASATLVSNPSRPLVVTTGEHQYCDAYGRLLCAEVCGAGPVPWAVVANQLQWHYLEITRQDTARPARPLSLHDMAYLHSRLSGRPTVDADTFAAFWHSWFGVAITGLRHSRLINALWGRGYIMGFISKAGAERLLRDQRCGAGTFLLRFSERAPGSFAIAYVKHSKVMVQGEAVLV